MLRITLLSVSFCLAACAVGDAPRARPNVLFILIDDLGWSDVSYQGSDVYETPNVDRLAAEGMVFTDFYCAGPVCSPTRASILTGKYPARTGITTFLLTPNRDPKHVTHHLDLEEFTIAEAFAKRGYTTGYFGKWHLGYESEHWASQQGFDVAIGGMDLPHAWKLAHPDKPAPVLDRRKGHTRFFSPHHLTHMTDGPDGEYLTDRLTDETIRFVRDNKERSFFALLSFHTVHTPLQAKPEVVEKYRRKIQSLGLAGKKEPNRREKRFQNNPDYAAMVQHMDENVGRLLRALDREGLSDDTIVVFTSDNGGKGSVTSNLPLRGAKHNLYEGGIRVPMIVRWPGRVPAGSRSREPLITNDFYPTLLELAGCAFEPHQHVDGESFAPVLLGQSASLPRRALYWHYPHNRQEGAVRRGRYKLLERFRSGETELYDLSQDIGERHDLSASLPAVARRMRADLERWRGSVQARFTRGAK